MEGFIEFNPTFDDFGVDFSDCKIDTFDVIKKPKEKQNHITTTLDEYDEDTKERYRVLRLRKMDPIALVDLDPNYSFPFSHKWDPYTGERKGKDENGALWFDPDILIKHFYTKRLNKLWIKESDENGGYFQGIYDDGVGAGEDFFLTARGHHPEWYLFRLPIIDCYLTKSHNTQIITFGPKLTEDEITEIERLANLRPNNYRNLFGYNRPSLSEMKRLYDIAIAKIPRVDPDDIANMTQNELTQYYNKLNRQAVDTLMKMKG
ncbi:hypothetical protein QKU48_gp0580 [Fadolivirus algeromassiliense]|jgi:hypothetical protein|uniref:Uncharacterized protein n=1 Tax=Fadolivirus FV1/VV64 TaxID=3070911 RepID=A0A7D3R1T5_9VIRU|nr:hypothetical protein QKU48_gp0580 [Fadolivirus algeromassiliense]QKF94038.1 hypothetical protein Fadolivirus_1_580 [Fadolivirus FV1/VV64]